MIFSSQFLKKLFSKTHFDAKNVFEFHWLHLQLGTGSRCRKVNSSHGHTKTVAASFLLVKNNLNP